jgi:hypothetical protein
MKDILTSFRHVKITTSLLVLRMKSGKSGVIMLNMGTDIGPLLCANYMREVMSFISPPNSLQAAVTKHYRENSL